MYLCFGKVVLGASGEGVWVKTFEEIFGWNGVIRVWKWDFLFVRVCLCFVEDVRGFFLVLCDGFCCFLEFCFFLDLYRYFSLGKREAWGLERLN